jgi:hypothetical protein
MTRALEVKPKNAVFRVGSPPAVTGTRHIARTTVVTSR